MDQMTTILDSLDAKLVGATIKQDLTRVFDDVCDQFGFEYYCLKTNLRLRDGERRSLKITNYPAAWLRRYSDSGYARIDPAANHAIDHVAAASLEQLMAKAEHCALKKGFKDDAQDMGIGIGITMPLRSPYLTGFINFNCKNRDENKQFSNLAGSFSSKLCESLGQFCIGDDVIDGYHSLTLREKQVAFWGAYGKTAWETSMILGISQRTIIAHLINAMAKLQCSNKYQMLSRISAFIDSDPALDEFRIEL